MPTDGTAARAAAEQAAEKLAEAQQRWPAVRRVAARLDASRDPDELAARITEAYRSM